MSSGAPAVWTQYSNPALSGSYIDERHLQEMPPSYKDSLQPLPCRQESSTSNDSYFTCCVNNITPVASSTLLGVAPTSWSTVERDTLQPSPLRQESNASNDSYVTCFSHSRSSPTPTINNGGPSMSLDSALSSSRARLAVFATPDSSGGGGGERTLPPRPSTGKQAPGTDQAPDEALIQQTLRGGLTTTWQRSSPSSRSYDEASRRRFFDLYPRPLQITHISFEDILAPTDSDGGQTSRYRRPADGRDRGWASPDAARSPQSPAPMSATGQALKRAFKTHRQDGRDTSGSRGPCPPPPLPPHPLGDSQHSPGYSDSCPAGSSGCDPGRTPGTVQMPPVGNASKLRRAFFVTGKHPARRLLPEQASNSNNQSGTCLTL